MKMIAFLFLLYIGWCFLAAIFGWDVGSSTDTYVEDHSNESEPLFDKVYNDGSYRVKGPLESTIIRMARPRILDFGVRKSGATVSNGWVFDKDRNHVGYEYDDILGITHRCDRN